LTTGEVNDDALAHAAVPDLLADRVADGDPEQRAGLDGDAARDLDLGGLLHGFLLVR